MIWNPSSKMLWWVVEQNTCTYNAWENTRRWFKAWDKFILLWAFYSSFFTPLEFGFYRGLPENLFILDIAGQIAFLVDIVLGFFVAYRDKQTYRMIHHRRPIAFRYLKSTFFVDLLACMPWDLIFKVFFLLIFLK